MLEASRTLSLVPSSRPFHWQQLLLKVVSGSRLAWAMRTLMGKGLNTLGLEILAGEHLNVQLLRVSAVHTESPLHLEWPQRWPFVICLKLEIMSFASMMFMGARSVSFDEFSIQPLELLLHLST